MKYVYRGVNALLGAAAIAAAFFVNFFRIELSFTDSAWELISKVGNIFAAKKQADPLPSGGVGLLEEFSIKRTIELFTGKDPLSTLFESSKLSWPVIFNPIRNWLILFAVLFGLMLVAAIFVIVWSICSNRRIPIFVAGVLGVIFTIGMMHVFRQWATPLCDGTINVAGWISQRIFGTSDAVSGIMKTVLQGLVGVALDNIFTFNIALCGLQNAMIIVFGCVVIWTAIFWLVDIGDAEVKEEKQAYKEYRASLKVTKKAKKETENARKELSEAESRGETETLELSEKLKEAEKAYEKAKKETEKIFDKTEDGKAKIRREMKKAAKAKEAAKQAKETE
ncbi:MAG: hypothetical protein MJ125_05920 [Clostridia bacterium]|nr:hypothetical protein [Clostridia bacterium]